MVLCSTHLFAYKELKQKGLKVYLRFVPSGRRQQWETSCESETFNYPDYSMRWFSHRRSPSSRAARNDIVCCCVLRAACCVRPSYGARPTMHCQWGWLSSFSFFLSLVTLTFDLDIRARARFLYNVPNRQVWSSYVRKLSCGQTHWQTNWQTDKQTPLKTSTALRYAAPVDNKQRCSTSLHAQRTQAVSSESDISSASLCASRFWMQGPNIKLVLPADHSTKQSTTRPVDYWNSRLRQNWTQRHRKTHGVSDPTV